MITTIPAWLPAVPLRQTRPECPECGSVMDLAVITQGEDQDGQEAFLGYVWWCPHEGCPEATDYYLSGQQLQLFAIITAIDTQGEAPII